MRRQRPVGSGHRQRSEAQPKTCRFGAQAAQRSAGKDLSGRGTGRAAKRRQRPVGSGHRPRIEAQAETCRVGAQAAERSAGKDLSGWGAGRAAKRRQRPVGSGRRRAAKRRQGPDRSRGSEAAFSRKVRSIRVPLVPLGTQPFFLRGGLRNRVPLGIQPFFFAGSFLAIAFRWELSPAGFVPDGTRAQAGSRQVEGE